MLRQYARVPLFYRNQPIEIRFQNKELSGAIVYEKSRDLAVRMMPLSSGRDVSPSLINQLRETFTRENVYVEYRHGNYTCSFRTRLVNVEPDLSDDEGTVIVNLEVPGRVRRVLDPTGAR